MDFIGSVAGPGDASGVAGADEATSRPTVPITHVTFRGGRFGLLDHSTPLGATQARVLASLQESQSPA